MNQIEKFICEVSNDKVRKQMRTAHKQGIYEKRQFIDADMNLNRGDYIKWLKEMKNSFFHTIDAKQLILGSSEKTVSSIHSQIELDTVTFKGYTPRQIMDTLNGFDIYTIMLMLAKKIEEKNLSNEIDCLATQTSYVIGTYNGIRIAVRPKYGSKTICYLDTDDKNIGFINAKELLLTEVRLPLEVILNTANLVLNPDYIPEESDLIFDDKLYNGLVEAKTSKTYQILKQRFK
ncbi:MAG: hypothetical protein PHE54_04085 [Bacilli bacterium]|nr:hypothetical protein [Bacilli bacterium]